MGHGRGADDGFRGEYPQPLDWEKIIAELEAKGGDQAPKTGEEPGR